MTPEEKIDKAIAETAAALADGLDPSDLAVLVRNGVEIAEEMEDLDGPAKRALAHDYASELVDTFFESAGPRVRELVAGIDIPLLPEAVERAWVDPLLEKVAMQVLRSAIKSALPGLFDLVVDATKGAVAVNAGELDLAGLNVTDLAKGAADLVEMFHKPGVTPSGPMLERVAGLAKAALAAAAPTEEVTIHEGEELVVSLGEGGSIDSIHTQPAGDAGEE